MTGATPLAKSGRVNCDPRRVRRVLSEERFCCIAAHKIVEAGSGEQA